MYPVAVRRWQQKMSNRKMILFLCSSRQKQLNTFARIRSFEKDIWSQFPAKDTYWTLTRVAMFSWLLENDHLQPRTWFIKQILRFVSSPDDDSLGNFSHDLDQSKSREGFLLLDWFPESVSGTSHSKESSRDSALNEAINVWWGRRCSLLYCFTFHLLSCFCQ
jgi:hypothetical protein